MTTLEIIAGIAIIAAFAFGYSIGHHIGETDGYAEHEDYCRVIRKCKESRYGE